MKSYNDTVIRRIDLLLSKSTMLSFESQNEFESYLLTLREHIKSADYFSFQEDGFSALKILIKTKRNFIKMSSSKENLSFVKCLIDELRDVLSINDSVIISMLKFESVGRLYPILLLILVCVTTISLFVYF